MWLDAEWNCLPGSSTNIEPQDFGLRRWLIGWSVCHTNKKTRIWTLQNTCLKIMQNNVTLKIIWYYGKDSVETLKKIRGFGRRGTRGDSNKESNPGSPSGQWPYCLRSCSGKNLTICICKHTQLYSSRIKCLQCTSLGRKCLQCASSGGIYLWISQGSLE